MKSAFEQYLDRVDEMVGVKAEFHRITEESEQPSVWVITYKNVPEPGEITAFTFGLSSTNHPNWKLGRPELVICVRSRNIDWSLAIGFLVKRFHGQCPFSYGNVLAFGQNISKESNMNAFLLFLPTILNQEEGHVELADRKINIVQAYPIYEEEKKLVEKMGAQRFFMQDAIDFADIKRANTGRILSQPT